MLVYGAPAGGKATVRPLDPNRTVRVTAKGAGNPGDPLVLADGVTTAADKGKVRKVPATAGRTASSALPRRRLSTASWFDAPDVRERHGQFQLAVARNRRRDRQAIRRSPKEHPAAAPTSIEIIYA